MGEIIDNSHIKFNISGDDSNNILYGYDNNDTIAGGKGNDSLHGGNGIDTYIYHKGDGSDIINDWSQENTLVFKDISKNEVDLTVDNTTDLLIKIKETGDTITLKGVLSNQGRFFNIEFSDGIRVNSEELEFNAVGDDQNNILYGFSNNDILIGSKGNDKLYGREGDDTYVYYKVDGNDYIDDWNGATTFDFKDMVLADVEFIKQNKDLLIKIKDTNEVITVANIFDYYLGRKSYFKFSDGTIFENTDINLIVNGGDTRDTLIGGNSNNIIFDPNLSVKR